MKNLSTASISLESGVTTEFLQYQHRRGRYLVYISASLAPADLVNLDLYLRPARNLPAQLYESFSLTDGQLFTLDVPPCYGFVLRFTNVGGRPSKELTLSIWRL